MYNVIVSNLDSCILAHSLVHLREESEVKWLHSCLLCPDEGSFRTMYKTDVRRHIRNKHRLLKLKPRVHYLDCCKDFWLVIKVMRDQCFENAEGFVTPKDFLQRSPTFSKNRLIASGHKKSYNVIYIKCSICKLDVKLVDKEKRLHALKHLPDKTKIQWLYMCLICKKIKQQQYCSIFFAPSSRCGILRHLNCKHRIGVNSAKQNVHYVDRSHKYERIITNLEQKCFANSPTVVYCCENTGIACTYCGLRIGKNRLSQMQEHSLSHLPKETGIKWLLSCSSCPTKCVDYRYMNKHILLKHKIRNPQSGKHFIDKRPGYKSKMKKFVLKCFPSSAAHLS